MEKVDEIIEEAYQAFNTSPKQPADFAALAARLEVIAKKYNRFELLESAALYRRIGGAVTDMKDESELPHA